MNSIDPNAAKYLIKAKITADGVVEKPDVIGAVFGQTEGLLGDDLDLRDLQKSGRIGRIEVEVTSKGGKSEGIVYISSSLDQVETAIIASALETVDRVGPCKAGIKVIGIEDVRVTKREVVIERAKELLADLMKQSKGTGSDITDLIRQSIQVEGIISYGPDRCPAGPNVENSEAIIIVEGRSDVLNLLKAGIKNAIAVEGTNIPETVQTLSKEKVTTAFVDGDRGGELILRELFQVADIDFVARAPRAHEVEELSAKQLVKCLRNKIPGDQYMEMNGFTQESSEEPEERPAPRRERRVPAEEEPRRERRSRREHTSDDDEPKRERSLRGRDEDEPRRERREKYNTDAADRFRKKDEEQASEPAAEEEAPAAEEPKDEEESPRRRKTRDDSDKPKREPRSKKPAVEKILSDDQIIYRDLLRELSATHNAKILSADNTVINELPVKSLVDTLRVNSEGVAAIVFDGIISQRIVDVASEKNIPTVVGVKKGNIPKMPADLTLWTKEDLN
ncbi:MAG: DNA primase [Candidatus Methanomethylophilaceae archaeon]|nr:DNA primase [Candidatus Methanomethylophilaceae archaeon]